MIRYVVIYKNVGETPLQALEAWRSLHPIYTGVPASYAGRLDPMAEGKLLILLGEECKRQTRYTGLDKEYEIEVLLDIGSDTGDALGIVEYAGKETRVDSRVLESALRAERGRHMRAYPAYSSKTVNGKPLFLHTLEGNISNIEIPTHEERIYRIQEVTSAHIEARELKKRITYFLSLVPTSDEPSKQLGADFRIHDVGTSWERVFEKPVRTYALLTLRVSCGSGTYMRSLAPRIGEALGTRALALSIKRTKIGKQWHGFWFSQY